MNIHIILICTILVAAFAVLLSITVPVFATRVLALMYPRRHPRRIELVAELGEVPYFERVKWAAGVTATGLVDGIPCRVKLAAATARFVARGAVIVVCTWFLSRVMQDGGFNRVY